MTEVTVRDIRAARYCLAGVRPWFRRHGLDWQEFLDHGIDAGRLRATGDALVTPVIRAAEVRTGVTQARGPQARGPQVPAETGSEAGPEAGDPHG